MKINAFVSQRVKIARLISKLSHRQLAKRLEIKEELICKYENAEEEIPYVIQIHQEFNIPIEFIMGK